jgi:hypothetical protein
MYITYNKPEGQGFRFINAETDEIRIRVGRAHFIISESAEDHIDIEVPEGWIARSWLDRESHKRMKLLHRRPGDKF